MHEVQEANYRPIILSYQQKCQAVQAKAEEVAALPCEVAGLPDENLQALALSFRKTFETQF
jgi:hypothetical protein